MILVTGANGQLGNALKEYFSDTDAVFLSSNALDITQYEQIAKLIEYFSFTAIINCAAYTNVEKAEVEREKAFLVNTKGAENLAKFAKHMSIPLVHISTDYVFDGKKTQPYTELDETQPLNIYGKSKLEGETAIKVIGGAYIILRTSWLFSKYPNNFFTKILARLEKGDDIKILYDQTGTPTSAHGLAGVIYDILPKITDDMQEVFHYSNEGIASWYDFAYCIAKYQKCPEKCMPILSSDFLTNAERPSYSVLNKSKIKKHFDLIIPHWSEAVEMVFNRCRTLAK